MNTHDHHDDEPLPGEDELRKLYRSLPSREPTPAIDQAIRQAAAAAVRPTRKRMARWPVAAASAAVLVLAAGLSWRMREEPTAQQPAAAPTAQGASQPAAPAMPMPAASAPSQELVAQERTVASAPAPAAADHRVHDAMRASRQRSVAPLAETVAPAPAPAMAAPAPAPAAAPLSASASIESAANADRVAAEPQARPMMKAATMAAPPMRATDMPMAGLLIPNDATAANPADTPAQELAKIRQLFALHRHDEALQRLQAFRHAHPDMPLPDDLQAQLPDHE